MFIKTGGRETRKGFRKKQQESPGGAAWLIEESRVKGVKGVSRGGAVVSSLESQRR